MASSSGATRTVRSRRARSFRQATCVRPAPTTTDSISELRWGPGTALTVQLSQRKMLGQGQRQRPRPGRRRARSHDDGSRQEGAGAQDHRRVSQRAAQPDRHQRACSQHQRAAADQQRSGQRRAGQQSRGEPADAALQRDPPACGGVSARRRAEPRHDDEESRRAGDVEPFLQPVHGRRPDRRIRAHRFAAGPGGDLAGAVLPVQPDPAIDRAEQLDADRPCPEPLQGRRAAGDAGCAITT